MNILHLPNNIGGMSWALAECERALGHDSKVITFTDNAYGFRADDIIFRENNAFPVKLAKIIDTVMKARKGVDLYHFTYGASLLHAPRFGLNLADLPLYSREANIFFTFSGCDARQKYPTMARVGKTGASAACHDPNCYQGVCNSGKRDRYRKQAIEKAARYADHFFALNPDLLHFLPKEMTTFCPYVIPDIDHLEPKSTPFFAGDKFRIVHAPTDRAAKGTDIIIGAVEKINRNFGGIIDFQLVENLSRSDALAVYREADLLIDQVLIGWYGGVAVEAMKMGVPVACYIEDSDLEFVPQDMVADLPFLNVTVDTLYSQLANVVAHREQLQELAKKGSRFVEKWHDPIRITRDILGFAGPTDK